MKLETIAALCTLVAAANAHAAAKPDTGIFGRHAQLAQKRQETAVAGAAAAASSASSAKALQPLITSGIPTGTTFAASHTYAPGSTPSISNAPPIPSAFVFKAGEWPAADVVPPTNSPEVKEWMKELEGHDIPNINRTADGSCVGDPVAAAEAEKRGWWTCGGWTRDTDITICPDKLTWGVRKLLSYLDQEKLSATFFVVGSRCVERPELLLEEYMSGHELSIHTWSHHALTTLTNEQIVAELGWTRKIIKEVTGVSPTSMRPPYGDMDDRVRAIAKAMGMTPIIWTRTASGFSFDTFDWRVAAGQVTGAQQMDTFDQILGNASTIDTGFVVLQHDVHEITVDLAVGYTLPGARAHQPPFNLKRIGECNNIPLSNMYRETTTLVTDTNSTTKSSNTNTTASGNTTDTQGAAANKNAGSRTIALSAVSGLIVLASGLLLL
ncbi:hypothetical protein NLI96_g2691 [Meripilus lineatus]|uniref:chitin deacetylase n=1 Tax=Meripilus lineatus TaxID=2056292 RepID=A0AAD5V853_9APHY|nr:hypothetical protein NLI96_g2691 [Physisporinus lineatus]